MVVFENKVTEHVQDKLNMFKQGSNYGSNKSTLYPTYDVDWGARLNHLALPRGLNARLSCTIQINH